MTSLFLGKKSGQNTINYKSRLEHKLYLAREDPEPVFDLSGCNLKSVPSGVYSLCKVFRKKRLLLQENQLVSLTGGGQLSDLTLITHLDLHNNNLSTLSEDIGYLSNLQELNVSNNELNNLPYAVSSLPNLEVLNCAHNELRELPQNFDQLSNLNSLDLRGNTSLLEMPSVLIKLSHLKHLFVDSKLTEAIPSCVIQQGTSAILHYLSKDCKAPPITKEDGKKAQKLDKFNSSKTTTYCQKEKAEELLAVERQLQEQKRSEFELHSSLKQDKDKLLSSLIQQQRELEDGVNQFHLQKEQNRSKLLSHLAEVERSTEEAVKDLLILNRALRSSKWQEQERIELKLLLDFKTKCDMLHRKEVLDAMEALLSEEYARKDKFLTYENTRCEVVQNSLAKLIYGQITYCMLREVEWGEQVNTMLHMRDSRQSKLLATIDTDSEIQKALVVTLLQQTDLRSQGLVMQVALVEQQLAVLTAVELQRRNIDSQQHLNDLVENRKMLSELLLTLLQEQRERQRHLISKLQQLEVEHQACDSCPDFWLRQYQLLMTSQPNQRFSVLDPQLIHQLISANVSHYLPALATCHLQTLSLANLSQAGINNLEDQLAILGAVNTYLTHNEAQLKPSAPPEEHLYKPAQPRDPLPECVICMERECAIVFVPCGHLCACLCCATQLTLCPLCRAPLERKIHVIIP